MVSRRELVFFPVLQEQEQLGNRNTGPFTKTIFRLVMLVFRLWFVPPFSQFLPQQRSRGWKQGADMRRLLEPCLVTVSVACVSYLLFSSGLTPFCRPSLCT